MVKKDDLEEQMRKRLSELLNSMYFYDRVFGEDLKDFLEGKRYTKLKINIFRVNQDGIAKITKELTPEEILQQAGKAHDIKILDKRSRLYSDFKDHGKEYVLTMDARELGNASFDVIVLGNTLEIYNGNERLYSKKLERGSFNKDKLAKTYTNGILELRIGKRK